MTDIHNLYPFPVRGRSIPFNQKIRERKFCLKIRRNPISDIPQNFRETISAISKQTFTGR